MPTPVWLKEIEREKALERRNVLFNLSKRKYYIILGI